MWDEPYLETCCRSALHRLLLCESAGRPDDAALKDHPCLERLASMGFAVKRGDGRFVVTEAGKSRHAREIGPVS